MKKLIKLIIDDEVFARMVTIVLKNSSYELISADEDETDAVILTDEPSFTSENGVKTLYLLRHQGDCAAKNLILRPFAPEELLRAVAELSGDDESAKRASAGKLKSEPRLDKRTNA